jgi:hypothetical protein
MENKKEMQRDKITKFRTKLKRMASKVSNFASIPLVLMVLFCTCKGFTSLSYSQAGSTTCEEILKKDKDYLIQFNGNEYKDGDDVYICKGMLDPSKNIELIYADTKLPVNGIKWSWAECNCTPSNPLNHFATINTTNLVESNAKIKAKFIESRQDLPTYNKTVDLEVVIKTDIDVKFSTIGSTKSYLDDNKLKYDNTLNYNHPAFFIPSGNYDQLKGEFKPKKAYETIELKPYLENTNNSIPLQITPSKFLAAAQDITFNLGNNPLQHNEIAEIHSCQKGLYIMSRELKKYTINVHRLCETDDDVQVNYGEVQSATDVCVAPGADGTIDEYAIFSVGKPGISWVDKDDEVIQINGVKHVVAGPVVNQNGKFYCNTKTRAKNPPVPTCPQQIDFTSVINDVKKFYKDKANIELDFKIMPDIHMNYDSRLDDDKIANYLEASSDFRAKRYFATNGKPLTPELLIVNGVLGAESGSAAFGDQNVMFVQDVKQINTSLVWAHELGHAIWNLKHPESNPVWTETDPTKVMDPICWMKARIDGADLLNNHYIRFSYLLLLP